MSLLVDKLCARRGDFALEVPAWRVQAGAFHAVLGTNGAGKSSFFATLAGELAYRGAIHFHGRNLRDWPLRARAQHLGVLPQSSSTSFAFSAAEVVALGLTPLTLSRREGERRVAALLDRVGCAALAERPFPSLSGGERQRVNLARVLLQLSEAGAAPLLLLDEPTSAQDLAQQHAVLGLARELAAEQGYMVVAILHDLNQALRYCDECLLLSAGKPAAVGAPQHILQPQRVFEHWGYLPTRAQVDGRAVLA